MAMPLRTLAALGSVALGFTAFFAGPQPGYGQSFPPSQFSAPPFPRASIRPTMPGKPPANPLDNGTLGGKDPAQSGFIYAFLPPTATGGGGGGIGGFGGGIGGGIGGIGGGIGGIGGGIGGIGGIGGGIQGGIGGIGGFGGFGGFNGFNGGYANLGGYNHYTNAYTRANSPAAGVGFTGTNLPPGFGANFSGGLGVYGFGNPGLGAYYPSLGFGASFGGAMGAFGSSY